MKAGIITALFSAVVVSVAASTEPGLGPDDRIITLGAPVTEIIFALGLGDQVVAVDQSSILPPEARSKPQVGYVRSLSAEGILSLRPTLVIATEDLGPELARRQLAASGVRVVMVGSPTTPAEIEAIIVQLGEVAGRQTAAARMVQQLRDELAVSQFPVEIKRPRVIFLMLSPDGGLVPMAAGAEVKADTLIKLAGGENPFQSFTGYRPVGLESLLRADPDLIVVGFTGDGADLVRRLVNQPGWGTLRAVRRGQIHPVSLGDTLGFGPSLGQAVAQLSGWIQQLPPEPADKK